MVMTDSQQKLRQAIKVIPMEREKLLVSYISMLAIDMDQAEFLKRYLLDFAQLLTDYSALGQFELIDSILSTESGTAANSGQTQHLLVKLQQTTDHYLVFIERYEATENTHNLQELCEDLENLGESLAERFEIEDQLIQNSAAATG
ncbi:MAG TPA: hypothetical protein DD827_07705 [Gammaproteobacteria bacterium]|jgi:regulator of sigma D|nr:hypothetical protein [Gammaproteobacteria bacterium]